MLTDMTDDDGSDQGVDLSLLVRMDFCVRDVDAVRAAAERAVRLADPSLGDDEVAHEVGDDIEAALFAIVNAVGFDVLIEETDGLEVRAVASEVAYGLEDLIVESDD